MGYHIDSLDMIFGTQLADSRGDIGVIYAQGLMHVLVICFSGRNLGALFEVLCVGLSILNLKLFGVILVQTLGQIDRKEQLQGGFVPYKKFLLMFSARQELWSDSSSHFEGWLYGPIILALLRDCTSEIRTLGLIFKHCNTVLCLFTICYLIVFIYSDYKNNFLPSILHFYHHIFAELVHLYNLPLYWVGWGDKRVLVLGCRVV